MSEDVDAARDRAEAAFAAEIDHAVAQHFDSWDRLCVEPADDTETETEASEMVAVRAKNGRKQAMGYEAWYTSAGELWVRCPDCKSSHNVYVVKHCPCDGPHAQFPVVKKLQAIAKAAGCDDPTHALLRPQREMEGDDAPSFDAPADLLPGIRANVHGVLIVGATKLKLRFPKTSRISATLEYAEVRAGDWRYGYSIDGPNNRTGGPLTVDSGERFGTREACLIAAFARVEDTIRRWQSSPGCSANERKRLTAALGHVDVLRREHGVDHPVIAACGEQRAAEGNGKAEQKGAKGAKTKAQQRRDAERERVTAGWWQCNICRAKNPPAQKHCGQCRAIAGQTDILTPTPAGTTDDVETFTLPQGGQLLIRTQDVPLSRIVERSDNPRTEFDPVKLTELARSIEDVGQQQPGVVRLLADDRFELWLGARRLRALQQLKRKTMRVRVYPVMTPDWVLIRARCDENDKRKDLNPIDAAESLRQRLISYGWDPEGKGGPSMRKLAELVGVSQGEISLRLRLRDLPEPWRGRLIAQEITRSQAELLLPWTGRPAVLKALEKNIRKSATRDEMTTNDFEHELVEVLHDVSRSCTPGEYTQLVGRNNWGYISLTKKDLETHAAELDIAEVPSWYGRGKPERRAFNVARWEELDQQAAARKAERQEKRAAGGRGSKAGAREPSGPTPAELKARREQQRQQLETKVARYRTRWLQARAAERVAKAPAETIEYLQLCFAAMPDERSTREHELCGIVRELGGKAKRVDYGGVDVFTTLQTLPAGVTVDQVRRAAIAQWLQHDTTQWRSDLKARDVPYLAEKLGVDLATEWRCSQEFLELFSKAQLGDLAAEWKRDLEFGVAGDKRGEKVTALLQANANKRLPVPKILMKAKG